MEGGAAAEACVEGRDFVADQNKVGFVAAQNFLRLFVIAGVEKVEAVAVAGDVVGGG